MEKVDLVSQKNPPKVHMTALLKRSRLSEKAVEIELTRPAGFSFVPGQRIRFIQKSNERDYSLISTPEDPTLLLCVREVAGGAFSPYLASARVETRFHFSGPHGYFTFRSTSRTPVFIATGTGIAPFVSMGRSGEKGFILLHGVRSPQDLYYASFFRKIAKAYIPCISAFPMGSHSPAGNFAGRVTDYLETELPPLPYDFYLCGRGDMIRDATLLVDERFSDSYVYTEIFY